MASILDRYGIKEVADVTFYEIVDGKPGAPVLYLDTLKVSTIEQTAESTDARGGKGNPKLITWDYGKEITVSIEDALFSPKSMNIMFGKAGANLTKAKKEITKTTAIRLTSEGGLPGFITAEVFDSYAGSMKKNICMDTTIDSANEEVAFAGSGITLVGVFLEDGTELKTGESKSITSDTDWKTYTAVSANKGKRAFVKYTIKALASEIIISADSFPGTYYVTGDTYARSDESGKDQFFQFIIPKAKMSAENTITLEAEGDPSVFNMNLTVLRPESGDMMKLVQYDLENPAE